MNFIVFTIFFSTTTGSNTAILAYNQVFFNSASSSIGSYATGTLYAFYMLCPLFFAPLVIRLLGVKWAVFTGLVMYCYNVAAYPLATYFSKAQNYLLIGGSVIGGFAAGFLWAAQGTYFTMAAGEYARQKGMEKKKANGIFAGVFSFFYLMFEVGIASKHICINVELFLPSSSKLMSFLPPSSKLISTPHCHHTLVNTLRTGWRQVGGQAVPGGPVHGHQYVARGVRGGRHFGLLRGDVCQGLQTSQSQETAADIHEGGVGVAS